MANTIKLGTDGNWAVKENNLLAYNDENNIFKPIDFEFTRDSGATRVNEQGLIENVPIGVPRIDFSDGKGSLLLEPTSTNHFQQSNQFDTTWQISAVGVSVTPNQLGVGNSQDAWKLTEGTFDGDHYIRQTPNIGGVVSISVYAKAGTNDFLYIRGVNGDINKRTWFNLSNGTVGTSQGISAEMISMGDGWYRCVMVLDHQTAFEYYIGVSNADGVSTYQGSNNYIYIQNAQLEQLSYATSYIPTSGATATRNAETLSKANIGNLINSSEGVLYLETKSIADNNFKRISINNGSYTQSVLFDFDNTNTLFAKIFDGVSPLATIPAVNLNIENNNKIAIKYKINDFSLFVNGSKIGQATISSTPNGMDRLSFDLASSQPYYGNVKDLRVYNTALTDTQLQQLTS